VTRAAVERAHAGDGPTLIEAMTYRIGAHSTADDATRYRSEEEVAGWRARDPIDRFRRFLASSGVADEAFVSACETDAEAWVAEVRAGITSVDAPPASEMFDHAFAEPPATLLRQRERWVVDG
jgi:2-oxoisovalerate dehydrogenase E1 component alpha subunit